MDNFELSAHFANATTELTEVLAEKLVAKEHDLHGAKQALEDAKRHEQATAAKARDARERLAKLQSELINLETEATDTAIDNGSNFIELTKRALVIREQGAVLKRALKRHELYAARDAKRAVLVAQRGFADADHESASAEQYLTLNKVLVVMKQQAEVNGGAVSLDSKALQTGKIAVLGERLKQLARIQSDWIAAIEKHDATTAEDRRNYEQKVN